MRSRSPLSICLALLGALSFAVPTSPLLAADSRDDPSDPTTGATAPWRAELPAPATDDDFYPRDPAKEELGKLLFSDKILSGNLNLSCATCHHPLSDTGDGLSLPIGEGGNGLGVTRDTGQGAAAVPERVPRNAPPVFNLGAKEYERMFHDGRVAVDPAQPSGFLSPAGDALPAGLANVLAAQAMFPVTSGTEMAGQEGENRSPMPRRRASSPERAGSGSSSRPACRRFRSTSSFSGRLSPTSRPRTRSPMSTPPTPSPLSRPPPGGPTTVPSTATCAAIGAR